MAKRLRHIDDERHLGDQIRDASDRLRRADLVVRRLHRRSRGSGLLSGCRELDRVNPAVGVDTYRYGLSTVRGMLIGGMQDRGMLDGGVHERRTGPGTKQAEDGRMERLRPVGREADLVRTGPETLGGQLAGRLEQKCGPATGRIQSSGIRPAVTEGRDECLSRDRVQWRPRRRVEVGHHDTTLVAHLRHNRRPLTAAAYQVQYAPD